MRIALLAALALAIPVAAALPGACADPCVIGSSSFGYEPAAIAIESGASVVWTSSDYTHVTRDGKNLADADPCFEVIHPPGEPAPPVRFDLVEGALFATVGGETFACAGTVATPAGAALAYFCALHPTMRGTLLVEA